MIESITTCGRTYAQKLTFKLHGYGAVIQMLGDCEGTFPHFKIPSLKLRFEDDANVPANVIGRCAIFAKQNNGALLVHCYAGVSRSVAVALRLSEILNVPYVNKPEILLPNKELMKQHE